MQPNSALLFGAVLCLTASATFAQYKYVGPDGRVVYSDQPPPPAAKVVQKPPVAGNVASTTATSSSLPFALQQPVRNFPVTIYTTGDCDACNLGRALLSKRGIPFSEKTVKTQEDMKAFKDATAASQVPVLLIGSGKQLGFDEGAWNTALTAAGYPPNNVLPAGYKDAPPVAANPEKPLAQVVASPAAQPQAPAAPQAPAPSSLPAPPAAQAPAPAPERPARFKGF